MNGQGGLGGTGSLQNFAGNSPGADGTDSTFAGVTVARGAAGGNSGGGLWATTANIFAKVSGGKCVRALAAPQVRKEFDYFPSLAPVPTAEPQNGGQGGGYELTAQPSGDGGCSPEGFAGGARGLCGAANTNLGGGGGGGGGAGPGGNGGAGGTGGAGTAVGAGAAGGQGVNAVANTGAGGGGGAAGGEGSTLGGNGGSGGTGGSGQMTIIYHGPQAVFT